MTPSRLSQCATRGASLPDINRVVAAFERVLACSNAQRDSAIRRPLLLHDRWLPEQAFCVAERRRAIFIIVLDPVDAPVAVFLVEGDGASIANADLQVQLRRGASPDACLARPQKNEAQSEATI